MMNLRRDTISVFMEPHSWGTVDAFKKYDVYSDDGGL